MSLQERLDRGEVILLDGAMGTELQRRGAPMHRLAWSAAAVGTHPETVREIHEEYIEAGADVIITNTFSTARHVLEPAGMGDLVHRLNTQAVTLAQEARDRSAKERRVSIAGSISTFRAGLQQAYSPPPEQAQSSYREQAALLAEAGVDLILLEMMRDREHSAYALRAALETGLPTWVGFSCRSEKGIVRLLEGKPGDSFGPALDSVMSSGGSVVSVMHTTIEETTPALEVAMRHWSGPVGAYPHSGRFTMPHWRFDDIISPDDFLTQATRWVQMGVQILGACCGMGPEHIRRLRDGLPAHLPKARGS